MKIIKLHTIDSTNDYLKRLSVTDNLDDFTVIVAECQTNGKGQMGSKWLTKPRENLTLSVFIKDVVLTSDQHFLLNIMTSLAIYSVLESRLLPQLKVKWPNDILSEGKKVCGVLIESNLNKNKVKQTIIGIGLNVNQTEFDSSFRASSLKNITGVHYAVDELMIAVVKSLQDFYEMIKAEKYNELRVLYDQCLFRKNKPSTFENIEGERFSGFIKGVSDFGKLQVLLEDAVLKEFDLKEIKLLY